MIGCLPTQALAFLAVFVYATQAIAFEWKPGFRLGQVAVRLEPPLFYYTRLIAPQSTSPAVTTLQ